MGSLNGIELEVIGEVKSLNVFVSNVFVSEVVGNRPWREDTARRVVWRLAACKYSVVCFLFSALDIVCSNSEMHQFHLPTDEREEEVLSWPGKVTDCVAVAVA